MHGAGGDDSRKLIGARKAMTDEQLNSCLDSIQKRNKHSNCFLTFSGINLALTCLKQSCVVRSPKLFRVVDVLHSATSH